MANGLRPHERSGDGLRWHGDNGGYVLFRRHSADVPAITVMLFCRCTNSTRPGTTAERLHFCSQYRPSRYSRWVTYHDDVIKWKHFPRYWPFVWGIHRSPVNSPHKGQWRRALMFTLICVWINDWVSNREAGDLRRNRAHYDVNLMYWLIISTVAIKYPSMLQTIARHLSLSHLI